MGNLGKQGKCVNPRQEGLQNSLLLETDSSLEVKALLSPKGASPQGDFEKRPFPDSVSEQNVAIVEPFFTLRH